ncbi:MAG: hypothetical protein ABI182_07215 [Candidatus Baltobacteraceae bacterium]
MRPLTQIAFAASLVIAAACSRPAAIRPAPQSSPTILISNRGVSMSLESAVQKISFRPLLPSSNISHVAVIPPLGGEDTLQNRGIAIEYTAGGTTLLLSEWPRQKFTLTVGQSDLGASPCAVKAYKTDGAIWITRAGVVMTLQPDGVVRAERVFTEAARLVKTGNC